MKTFNSRSMTSMTMMTTLSMNYPLMIVERKWEEFSSCAPWDSFHISDSVLNLSKNGRWAKSLLSCWKFPTRSRRLADKLPCLLQLLEAKPSWGLRMELLLHLLLSPLQHHLGVAIVAAVREQGLAASSVQLNTRLPWQRQQQVLPWEGWALSIFF